MPGSWGYPYTGAPASAFIAAFERRLRWYQDRYPLKWLDMLNINHLGRHRLIQEAQAALKATRYDRHLKKEVPDWGTRTDARRDLAIWNGITPQGDFLREIELTGKGGGDGKKLDVGPAPATFEEWMKVALQVHETAMKHHQQPTAEETCNEHHRRHVDADIPERLRRPE